MAHHRWLLFFQFGKNGNSDDPELKKLKTLLKNDHIQVRKMYFAYLLMACFLSNLMHLMKLQKVSFKCSVRILGWEACICGLCVLFLLRMDISQSGSFLFLFFETCYTRFLGYMHY